MFSLIYAWINAWVNSREAGDLRRYRAHYDVSVMLSKLLYVLQSHQAYIINHRVRFVRFCGIAAWLTKGIIWFIGQAGHSLKAKLQNLGYNTFLNIVIRGPAVSELFYLGSGSLCGRSECLLTLTEKSYRCVNFMYRYNIFHTLLTMLCKTLNINTFAICFCYEMYIYH